MPQRRMASVSGSASPTRKRVTAAAVPPRQLETIAIRTPIPSPNFASCVRSACRAMVPIDIVHATTPEVVVPNDQSFPERLRWWRRQRGWSQLELASRAGVSQRHLGFLELGRARPSRDMVIRLATTLDVPLRQHNALLLAGGFAPIWRETDLGAPELVQIRAALDYILAQQEPFPAVAVDRHWNLLKANQGAVRLVEFLVGPLAPDTRINLADALVAPDVLRPYLVNWTDVMRYFIRSVETDAATDGSDLRDCCRMMGSGRRWGLTQSMRSPARWLPCIFTRAMFHCDCSPRSRHWEYHRTLHCKNFGSNAFSRPTATPRLYSAVGLQADVPSCPPLRRWPPENLGNIPVSR
jgi:transcriptional regulator with XRE-family HTH domain